MSTLQATSWRGFHILDVLEVFERPFRDDIWGAITSHPLYAALDGDTSLSIVVSGKWLRKLIGHVAVEGDRLTEYRRHFPPITDKDQILIEYYSQP